MNTPEPTSRPVNVFVSYAHKDTKYMEQLRVSLTMMRRQKIIEDWTDQKIVPSDDWDEEIKQAFEKSDLVLLLISPDFIASDYIWDVELKLAMEAHNAGTKRVIPIWVRPTEDKGAPYLKLQGLPSGKNPVSTWSDPDEAWLDVAKGIRRMIEKYYRGKSAGKSSWITPEEAIHISDPHLPLRNTDFTGRDAYFDSIHEHLSSDSSKATAITQSTAISGLGGVGKTELAVEYVYRYHGDYDRCWYIICDPVERLRSSFAALAGDVGLPEAAPNVEEEVRIQAVKSWLRTHGHWLIVYDNVNAPTDIKPYLVGEGGGHQLITSRCREWDGHVRALELETFSPEDAVRYLRTRLGEIDDAEAGTLADTLGYLPLALAQAAAYMRQTGESINGFLELFNGQRDMLLAQGLIDDNDKTAVSTTWNISLDAAAGYLKKKGHPDSLAADLLKLIAFFAPDNIPLETIQAQSELLPEPFGSAAADKAVFNDIIAVLQNYSLATRKGDDLSVHRLVQAVMFDRMEYDVARGWGEAALKILKGAIGSLNIQDHRTWPVAERHVTHALHCVKETEALGLASDEQQSLLNKAAWFKESQLDFTTALDLYERAYKCALQVHGEESAPVAVVLSKWGDLLRQLGQLPAAKEKLELALAIDEAVYGPDHQEVATDLNNLAGVLKAQGDLSGARERHERALAIDEAVYGPDHPDVAIDLNNLAMVLKDQGDLPGARERFERALAIDEAVYGPNHPNVATRLNNLAMVLREEGDLDGARERFERALAIDEAVYGPNHPNVAYCLNNLAGVLMAQGDLAGARERYQRALHIFTKVYGSDHPNTRTVQGNLDHLLKQIG